MQPQSPYDLMATALQQMNEALELARKAQRYASTAIIFTHVSIGLTILLSVVNLMVAYFGITNR